MTFRRQVLLRTSGGAPNPTLGQPWVCSDIDFAALGRWSSVLRWRALRFGWVLTGQSEADTYVIGWFTQLFTITWNDGSADTGPLLLARDAPVIELDYILGANWQGKISLVTSVAALSNSHLLSYWMDLEGLLDDGQVDATVPVTLCGGLG